MNLPKKCTTRHVRSVSRSPEPLSNCLVLTAVAILNVFSETELDADCPSALTARAKIDIAEAAKVSLEDLRRLFEEYFFLKLMRTHFYRCLEMGYALPTSSEEAQYQLENMGPKDQIHQSVYLDDQSKDIRLANEENALKQMENDYKIHLKLDHGKHKVSKNRYRDIGDRWNYRIPKFNHRSPRGRNRQSNVPIYRPEDSLGHYRGTEAWIW